MQQPAPELRVIIVVDVDRMDAVVRALAEIGVRIDQEIPAIGVVIGHVPEALITTIGRIDGVSAVEAERQVVIDGPDSDLPERADPHPG
jgi:hypothetical protein